MSCSDAGSVQRPGRERANSREPAAAPGWAKPFRATHQKDGDQDGRLGNAVDQPVGKDRPPLSGPLGHHRLHCEHRLTVSRSGRTAKMTEDQLAVGDRDVIEFDLREARRPACGFMGWVRNRSMRQGVNSAQLKTPSFVCVRTDVRVNVWGPARFPGRGFELVCLTVPPVVRGGRRCYARRRMRPIANRFRNKEENCGNTNQKYTRSAHHRRNRWTKAQTKPTHMAKGCQGRVRQHPIN